MTDPACLTCLAASRAIDAGTLTPAELLDAIIARIARAEPQIHAYLRLDLDRARALAQQAGLRAAAGRRLSPLDGLPFGVKDNFLTRSMATTAGSAVPQAHDPQMQAGLVTRLEAAGAILLGKCNTWEFGTGTGHVHFDLPHPPARNPWDPARYTGGSSSGSAAAVAAGLASFTLGTDSGGSVRLPAAGCGVVGFKPTFGRMSRQGIIPNTWSFDTPGPICADVADAALLHDLLAGHDPADPVSLARPVIPALPDLHRPVRGLRLGVVRNLEGPGGLPQPAILEALAGAEAALGDLGMQVMSLDMPVAPSEFRAVAAVINNAESFAVHEQDFHHHRHRMGRALREKLETGFYLRAVDYLAAARERRRLVAAVDALFDRVDILLLPMTYRCAPVITEPEAVRDFTTGSAGSVFSLTGHPALSLPAGRNDQGAPVAVQLAAAYCDDARLLRVAAALETAQAEAGHWRPARAPLQGMENAA